MRGKGIGVKNMARLLIVGALLSGGIWGSVKLYHKLVIKETGDALYSLKGKGGCMWFLRHNQESFEMCFDNPPALQVGWVYDVFYRDDNEDLRHFEKVRVVEYIGVPGRAQ